MCDTDGQTPGTRRNGTDLQTAAEKAIAALAVSAPIVEPDEPMAPPSRPAIPPPPVETELEIPPALSVDEEIAADELLEARPNDDTFGTMRPVEIDTDESEPFVPLVGLEPTARRAWFVRGAAAVAVLAVTVIAFGAAFSERAPTTLGKGVPSPHFVVAAAPVPIPAVEETAESAAAEPEPAVAETAPAKVKKIVHGATGFFGFEPKKGSKGTRGTTVERVPFGSIPSRDDEPMGVYPFLIRDKAPEDQPSLPPTPAPVP
jgi:hypothetical protein